MAQTRTNNQIKKSTLKFVVPEELKGALQTLADERNITLSALLRLITSEDVKRPSYIRRNTMSMTIAARGSGELWLALVTNTITSSSIIRQPWDY